MPVHSAVMVRLHRADAIPAKTVAVQFFADRRKKRVNQVIAGVFTAGSATVTPKLNGVAGPAFQVIKDSLTLGLNALTLTDITKNAAYGVEIESLVLEINAPASS